MDQGKQTTFYLVAQDSPPERELKRGGIMAERMRKTHQDDVRAKIQTSQLINRLTDHALGNVELTATQVRAIEILIKKTLPDLQAIAHSAGDDETAQVLAGLGAFKWQRSQ